MQKKQDILMIPDIQSSTMLPLYFTFKFIPKFYDYSHYKLCVQIFNYCYKMSEGQHTLGSIIGLLLQKLFIQMLKKL